MYLDLLNGMYFDSISLFPSGLSLRPLNGERGGGLARLIRDHWPLASVALGMLDEPETERKRAMRCEGKRVREATLLERLIEEVERSEMEDKLNQSHKQNIENL